MNEPNVPRSGKVSDEERLIAVILKRVALNDHAAFQQIYDLTASRFMSLLMKILFNDKAEAEEVLQDAFVKIWKKANTFRDGSPMAWMTVIVRNSALDLIRSKKRRIDTLSEADSTLKCNAVNSRSSERFLHHLEWRFKA